HGAVHGAQAGRDAEGGAMTPATTECRPLPPPRLVRCVGRAIVAGLRAVAGSWCKHHRSSDPRDGSVSKVEMVTPMALIYKMLFSSISTFEAPPNLLSNDFCSLTYVIAAVRVAFGVLLFAVAKDSRAPRTLRVVAFIPFVAGLATPFVGVERAWATIEWWSEQGTGVVRL